MAKEIPDCIYYVEGKCPHCGHEIRKASLKSIDEIEVDRCPKCSGNISGCLHWIITQAELSLDFWIRHYSYLDGYGDVRKAAEEQLRVCSQVFERAMEVLGGESGED